MVNNADLLRRMGDWMVYSGWQWWISSHSWFIFMASLLLLVQMNHSTIIFWFMMIDDWSDKTWYWLRVAFLMVQKMAPDASKRGIASMVSSGVKTAPWLAAQSPNWRFNWGVPFNYQMNSILGKYPPVNRLWFINPGLTFTGRILEPNVWPHRRVSSGFLAELRWKNPCGNWSEKKWSTLCVCVSVPYLS